MHRFRQSSSLPCICSAVPLARVWVMPLCPTVWRWEETGKRGSLWRAHLCVLLPGPRPPLLRPDPSHIKLSADTSDTHIPGLSQSMVGSPLFSSTITWLFRIDHCNLPPPVQGYTTVLENWRAPPKSLQILGTPSFQLQLPLLTGPLCLLFLLFCV